MAKCWVCKGKAPQPLRALKLLCMACAQLGTAACRSKHHVMGCTLHTNSAAVSVELPVRSGRMANC